MNESSAATLTAHPWALAFAGLAMLAAGTMRGFSGFGAAMLGMPALSMVFPPALAAPIMTSIQVLSSLQTARADRPHILWRQALILAAASGLAALVGARLLVVTTPCVSRLIMGCIVLAAVAVLASGWRYRSQPRLGLTLSAGAFSGLGNGFAAIGGPPLVAYFLGGPFSPLNARATMTIVFAAQSAVSLLTLAAMGKVSLHTLLFVLIAYPLQAAGIVLGRRLFLRHGDSHYRRVCILILALMALLLIARSAWDSLT
ncbi:sulfite exporter TauE/SafE family protein [Bordetella sp. FB-8]|uniref:sulfite exporter TauE/SafE family protein n=1 Tax=Bordetella sp. FB-8 TaxID=1159870 RepID=UPI00035DDF74|nr:sulfite exporter TauE/SafE family protein [Bordetella sp. FB-8]